MIWCLSESLLVRLAGPVHCILSDLRFAEWTRDMVLHPTIDALLMIVMPAVTGENNDLMCAFSWWLCIILIETAQADTTLKVVGLQARL